jgi:glycosyltransferase involved in cell wall biosynthesis
MNITYLTNVRIPTPRAQGYAVMKMCSEFTKAGARIKLVVPARRNSKSKEDPFDFYKIEKNFEIKRISSFDFLGKRERSIKIFYWIDILSFLVVSKFLLNMKSQDVLYTRDFMTTLFFSKKYFICLELHDIPKSKFLFRLAIKKAKLFFVLNVYLKKELLKMGIPEDKIHIASSGVELKDFDIEINKNDARQKTDLPRDKNIVMYTGHLYEWKGADTLAEAAQFLPETLFVFVGGVPPESDKFIGKYKKYQNIIVRSFVERSMIPLYLKSADALVLPNSASEKISSEYTSPLKLFEYMASGRPIIASDLPSIREIVNEKTAVFAETDNPQSFAGAIKRILENKVLAQALTENVHHEIQKYSWQKRAENILSVINK